MIRFPEVSEVMDLRKDSITVILLDNHNSFLHLKSYHPYSKKPLLIANVEHNRKQLNMMQRSALMGTPDTMASHGSEILHLWLKNIMGEGIEETRKAVNLL